MKIIGITGGIASGKSTVGVMLRRLQAAVVEADALYHGLLEPQGGAPSPLGEEIAAAFPGVLTQRGTIDRAVLGAEVFAQPQKRRHLEAITHPAVAQAFAQQAENLRRTGAALIYYDVPLLFERGLEEKLQGVVVVWVPRPVQLRRLMHRDRLDGAKARQKLDAQMPLDEKRARADWIIDNSDGRENTQRQVTTLHETLLLGTA